MKLRIEIMNEKELASLQTIQGDVVIKQSYISMTDLALSLVKILDDHLLIDRLLIDLEPEELLERLMTHANYVDFDTEDFFDCMLKKIAEEYGQQNLGLKLFRSVASSFDLTSLSYAESLEIVRGVQSSVNSWTKTEHKMELEEMLIVLIEKINIYAEDKGHYPKLLTALLENALHKNQQDEIDETFRILSMGIRRSTLVQVAAPVLEDYPITSPILPRNCIYYQEKGKSKRVAIEVEKGMYDIPFEDVKPLVFEQVGHPKLIFVFDLNDKGRVSAKVWAIKDTFVKGTSKTYHFPFSNVYKDGKICWPALGHEKYDNIRQMESMPYQFLGAPKNFHLYDSDYTGIDLRGVLTMFSGKEFDDDMLEDTGLTLEEWLTS